MSMPDTLDVLRSPTFSNRRTLSQASPSAFTSTGRYGTRAPASVPSGQAYYWTQRWQEGEERALRELQRGEGSDFDNGRDAVRWLLDND